MANEANIDWTNIGFGYIPTDYNIRATYKDGNGASRVFPTASM